MPKSVKRKAPRRWAVIAVILAIIVMLLPVAVAVFTDVAWFNSCLLYTSPSPRD